MPPGFLVEDIGYPRYGPHLSAMGMSAELEVDGCILSFLEVVGLMVKEYGKDIFRVCQLRECLSVTVAAVVSADDADALDVGSFVLEQLDSGGCEERLSTFYTADILVIAEDGQYGSLQAMELFGIVSFEQWAGAAVDDVSADEYQVGLFSVEEVNPSREFGLTVVVADVEVAGKDDGQGFPERFRGADGQFLAVFVSVMYIPCHHDSCHDSEHREEPRTAVIQACFGQQATEQQDVCHEEDDQQIEESDEPRVAHFVERRCSGH